MKRKSATARSQPQSKPAWWAHEPGSSRLAVVLLAACILFVYANSLHVPFVLDDTHGIVENSTIHDLGRLHDVLRPPTDGSTVTGRPMVNLSLAINHAVGGFAVEGYHVVNIAIHIAAALALFALVRRTLVLPWAPERARAHAPALAFAASLIWAVHPLNTEAVTYIIQRAEALGGLFLLLVLLAFARSIDSKETRGGLWRGLTVAFCALGMATKETVAAAPLLVCLYDRTFVAGTFAEAWRRRRALYGILASTWLILGLLVWSGSSRGGSVGFGKDVGPWSSLLTQADAIVMYLRLTVWPSPLVFDYGSSVSDVVRHVGAVWMQGILVLTLLAGTIWALIRRPPLGFAGAWFFLILAPSSSVVPVLSQMRAEHRMYLPLAAITVVAAVATYRRLGQWTWAVAAAAAIALGVTTIDRNRDYATSLRLWNDTAAKAPHNPRAHYNRGFELFRSGNRREAIDAYATAVRLDPNYAVAHTNLATLLVLDGRPAEALPHAEAAVRLEPTSGAMRNALGRARFESGDLAGGLQAFEEAVRLAPADAGSQRNLGMALARLGQPARALEHLTAAAASNPDANLLVMIGEAHLDLGHHDDARRTLEAALKLQPGHGMAHFHLGMLLAGSGRTEDALPHLEQAVRAMPREIPPLYNFGLALQATGRTPAAIRCFEQVLAIDPRDADAADMVRRLRASAP